MSRCSTLAEGHKPYVVGASMVGKSGTTYRNKAILQDKGPPWGSVYLATDGNNDFVIKEIPQEWAARSVIYDTVQKCRHVRLPVDTIPKQRIMIFRYAEDHMLNLVQKDLPLAKVKHILKCALQGLADMHDVGVLHNDVKPNNIVVHTNRASTAVDAEEVYLTDLEDGVVLKEGQFLRGAPFGNYMWRSPEAHAEGPVQFSSDVFSFAVTAIYAVTRMIVFAVQNPDLSEEDKVTSIYFRALSYFATVGESEGLLDYLGADHPMREVYEAVERLCSDVPRDPFSAWDIPGLDSDFKDLIGKMTKLDPRKRISAREALSHPWFRRE